MSSVLSLLWCMLYVLHFCCIVLPYAFCIMSSLLCISMSCVLCLMHAALCIVSAVYAYVRLWCPVVSFTCTFGLCLCVGVCVRACGALVCVVYVYCRVLL